MTRTIDQILAEARTTETPFELYMELQSAVGGFHPDEYAEALMRVADGRRVFNAEQAPLVDTLADRAFEDGDNMGVDVYGAVLDLYLNSEEEE